MHPTDEFKDLDLTRLPKHVGIIMDGNGRWATKRGLTRLEGHKKARKAVRAAIRLANDIGLQNLTLYTFSTENWLRPPSEVSGLFKLILQTLTSNLKELHQKNVRIRIIGYIPGLPKMFWDKFRKLLAKTTSNDGLNLIFAINYGGRKDITDAVVDIAKDVKKGNIKIADISEELISSYLYTKEIPDPDLIIRTSGEQRLSNFLTWQSAYSELVFIDDLWPDFSRETFLDILVKYQNRVRKFGGLDNA